ncbi:MAG: reverse transcriptase family protein, partial [Candidatus Thiodiazotropha sp.]
MIDSGSNITTVCEEFYQSLPHKPVLKSLNDFDLEVECAGGNKLPYTGYIEATLQVHFLPHSEIEVPVLVVPTTEYSLKVPVVIGTNVIRQCRNMCDSDMIVPAEWKDAFISSQIGHIGVVKSTNKIPLKIQPNETVTLSGLVRKSRQVDTAVTETTEGASSRIGVCPRVVKISKDEKCERVAVRIFNISAKTLEIQPKSSLCELHEVKVLRSVDPIQQEGKHARNNQQRAQASTTAQLPDKIDLTDSNITEKEKERLKEFLNKWQGIFSKGVTDLGKCDLVKHQIKLTDDQPFKEPHRRIPPALFQEVREHLREMIEAGAIRPSESPYSSNVVIVRKKDGSIRFCVDFRKLNNRTIKDAYALPRVEDTLHLLAGSRYFTKLDLRSGYWQVEIDEPDKHKTAFQVGTLGFFEFHRMPFGLCNAPATFQRL